VFSPLDLLDDELSATATDEANNESAADEVARYLRQGNIRQQQCPLAQWKANSSTYPRVAQVARRYLSAPSTSVPSERLFSSAGDLSDSRRRLLPEPAEMLLFIKENIHLVN